MSLFSKTWLDANKCGSVPPTELKKCLPSFPMEEGLQRLDYDGLISTTLLNLEMETCQVSLSPIDLAAQFMKDQWELNKKRTPWTKVLNPAIPKTEQLILPWRGREEERIQRMDACSNPRNIGPTMAQTMGGTEQCLLRI